MNNKLLFFAALAVLNCPMSVEEKIKTLKGQLVNLTEEDLNEFSKITTGLEPFDNAWKSLLLEKAYKNQLSKLNG